MTDPLDDIRDVWGDYDDFQQGGFNYAAFVVREDLREMEQEGWSQPASTREFSDVAINSLRALDELSKFEPWTALRYRLDSHLDKGPEAIIDRYQARFEDRL